MKAEGVPPTCPKKETIEPGDLTSRRKKRTPKSLVHREGRKGAQTLIEKKKKTKVGK